MTVTDLKGAADRGGSVGRDTTEAELEREAHRHRSAAAAHQQITAPEGAEDQPLEDDRSSAPLPRAFLAQRQRAEVSLMVGRNAGFKAKAEITNGGLLSIAALVSSILLTTTVLVHVAVRDGKRPRWRL